MLKSNENLLIRISPNAESKFLAPGLVTGQHSSSAVLLPSGEKLGETCTAQSLL